MSNPCLKKNFSSQVEDEEEVGEDVPVFRSESQDPSRDCYFQDGVRKVGKTAHCLSHRN